MPDVKEPVAEPQIDKDKVVEPQNQNSKDTPEGDADKQQYSDEQKRVYKIQQESARHRVENIELRKKVDEMTALQDTLKRQIGGTTVTPDETIAQYKETTTRLEAQLDDMRIQSSVQSLSNVHPNATMALARAVKAGGVTVDQKTGDVVGFETVIENLQKTDPYYFTGEGNATQKQAIGAPTSTAQAAKPEQSTIQQYAEKCGFFGADALKKFEEKVWPNYKKLNKL